MSQPLRIGIIGAGNNTRLRHIPGFLAQPNVFIATVCNRSRKSGEKVAAEFKIPHVAANWQEVVDSPDIDAVCIGTWPNLHSKVTVAALRAGKHVLTEARMARSLAESELMLAEARLHPELVTQIVPAPMSLPFDAAIAKLLADGRLGHLREVIMTCTGNTMADAATPLNWRQNYALSGKNTLFMGIYYEMVHRWLKQEPLSLVASAGIFTKERKDAEGLMQPVQVPESVGILGTYADGARLVGHFSGVEVTNPRSEIRLNGSKGGLRLDLGKGELHFAAIGEKEQRVEVPAAKDGGWTVEADFVASIREKTPVTLTDFKSGVAYMRFTEAVWESWNNSSVRVTL